MHRSKMAGRSALLVLFVALGISLAFPARASTLVLPLFEISQLSVVQIGNGDSFSGEVSWNPYLSLGEDFGLSLNLGFMVLKGASSNTPAAEVALMLSMWKNRPWVLEFGGGLQKWFNGSGGATGGMGPEINVKAVYQLDSPLLAVINRFFIQTTALFNPAAFITMELKAGVGIDLGF